MDKGRRNEIAALKRKKRLKVWLRGVHRYKTRIGKVIMNPKLTDIPKTEHTVLKSTGKPCSCSICSPNKYNRAKAKRHVLAD